MKKNNLVKYFIFVLVLILVDQCIGTAISYFAQKQIRDNRIGLLIEGKIKSDICILGSSRALNNYNPGILVDSLKKSCYNFGLSGSNILYHEALIELLIKSANKPSVLIYSVDDHATFFDLQHIVFRKDAMLPYVYDETVNGIICKQLKKAEYATRFSKTYRENVNLINALKFPVYGQEVLDYKTNSIDSLGANLLVQRDIDPKAEFRVNKWRLDKLKINVAYWSAFRRIQEKCKASNIRIVFVLPPIYNNGYPGFKTILDKAILNDSPVIDYTYAFNDADLFFNTDHLNSKGAALFTNLLVKDLKKLGF